MENPPPALFPVCTAGQTYDFELEACPKTSGGQPEEMKRLNDKAVEDAVAARTACTEGMAFEANGGLMGGGGGWRAPRRRT